VKFPFGSRGWDREADVVVVGSGGGGLTAAIVARDQGAEVLLLEKTGKVGGTTAVSGGVVWVPCNHHMPEAGIADARDEALGYVKRLADGRGDEALIATYLDRAPEVLRYLEDRTPLKLVALKRYPDYHPEFPGGRPGGRSLDPGLFDTKTLGPWAEKLRRSPTFGMTAMSITEATDWNVFSKPLSLPYELLAKRLKQGLVCYGASLVGALLRGCLDRGIEPMLDVRARELVLDGGKVVGVVAEQGGKRIRIRARRGVILASGGFEWDAELCSRFLRGPLTHPNGPPSNEGDGLRMAMALGADLGNMTEAWWCPSLIVPGEEYDGKPLYRGDFAARALPHSIIVNRKGERFANEAQNYNDVMKPFFSFDPTSYTRPNLPAYLVLDQAFLDRYMLLTLVPGSRVPDWLPRADTLEALAAKLGVSPGGLRATADRFNAFAREGKDLDFGRGDSIYDHFYGDPENRPSPNLGTLEKAPFYALEVFPGGLGTKGGPRVDEHGRVQHVEGRAIDGLYAAGNVMAGVMGAGYPGAGSTIGTAMTWGYLAAKHASARKLADRQPARRWARAAAGASRQGCAGGTSEPCRTRSSAARRAA
jgi:3-oxosteroid 1-dehydrogenase